LLRARIQVLAIGADGDERDFLQFGYLPIVDRFDKGQKTTFGIAAEVSNCAGIVELSPARGDEDIAAIRADANRLR